MHLLRPDPIPTAEITDEALYLKRRSFLRGAAAAAAGLAILPGCFDSQEGRAASAPKGEALHFEPGPPDFSTEEKPTSYESSTSYNNFYELGTGKGDPARNAADLHTHPWSVAIEGEVARPGVVPLETLLRPHPLQERIYRMRCVEAWSMVIPWVGFPLGDLLKRFGPTSKARYVAFTTLMDPEHLPGQRRGLLDWPYREGLRIDEAMHPLTLLVVGMYGRVLPNQNGAPLRLVVPWKYGFKGIKSIVKIRLQAEQPVTTWNEENAHEYGFYANVNPDVDHPRWSQARERRIGEWRKRPTLFLNGYADQVASLYKGMDLRKNF